MISRTKLGFRKIKILSTFYPNDLEANCKVLFCKIFVPYGIISLVCVCVCTYIMCMVGCAATDGPC